MQCGIPSLEKRKSELLEYTVSVSVIYGLLEDVRGNAYSARERIIAASLDLIAASRRWENEFLKGEDVTLAGIRSTCVWLFGSLRGKIA